MEVIIFKLDYDSSFLKLWSMDPQGSTRSFQGVHGSVAKSKEILCETSHALNKSCLITADYGVVSNNFVISILERDSVTKDLGIHIDDCLLFKDHIYEKINTARKMLGIVKRSFRDLDKKCFLLIYKSMIRSHLEYGSCIWNPYKIGLIDDLEKVQKQATKLVNACENLDYSERLTFFRLPTLIYRRFRGDMIEVYKILNVYDCNIVPNLSRNINPITRGHLFRLQVNFSKLDVRKYLFCTE